MRALEEFRLPDLGEGLTEGEIVRWLVQPGDTVAINQPIVEVETAKAAVELPSPYAGIVTALHHDAGETVDVGTALLTVDTDPSHPDAGDTADLGSASPEPLLVGYGPKSHQATRRRRRAPSAALTGAITAPATSATGAPPPRPALARPLATPPVRKLARELGVDLALLAPGSGPEGAVTRADVEQAVEEVTVDTGARMATAVPAPDRERRIVVTGVRRAMAANMVASAFSAPHVTVFSTLDITSTMLLRERLADLPELAGVKLTPLVFVARALVLALRRHPMLNASWDEAAGEIVVKDYVNLGIAAATPRGLVVPNIKDAGRLSLRELATRLRELAETARGAKTAPADMLGGTITISNVGVFGVDTGTPILHPGQAAILALGVVRPTPWVHEGEIAIRQVVQLAVSFDHRVVDGQQGSAFLADIGALLTDPATALAWA